MTDTFANLFDSVSPVLGALVMAVAFSGALTCSTLWMISKDTCRLKFLVSLNLWAPIVAIFILPLSPSLQVLAVWISLGLLSPATAWLAFVGYRKSRSRWALRTAILLIALTLIFIFRAITYYTYVAGSE